jgi:CheY-like chemotaxis protein
MTVLDVAMDDSAKSKLLLVDDEVRFADGVARALERPGLEVRVCNDGASGLEAALRWPADLVLLDARMPGMDGWEVCRRLRAAGYSAPILMYSAYDTEEDTVAALGAGADDHVSKQASMVVLSAKIWRGLERHLSDKRSRWAEASPEGALGGSANAPPRAGHRESVTYSLGRAGSVLCWTGSSSHGSRSIFCRGWYAPREDSYRRSLSWRKGGDEARFPTASSTGRFQAFARSSSLAGGASRISPRRATGSCGASRRARGSDPRRGRP